MQQPDSFNVTSDFVTPESLASVRMLTEPEVWSCECSTYERSARAIQQKFMEVNGLASGVALPAVPHPQDRASTVQMDPEAARELARFKLAAQLAGVPACDGCGYRKEFCRCAAGVKEAGNG